MRRKKIKKIEKVMMKSEKGIILWILVGLFVLIFLLRTGQTILYILVIVGTPILFYLRSQDWLPYIYGGIILALFVQFVLGLILNTRLPVVAVVSSSMDHGISSTYPCGKMMNHYTENFDNWWKLCGSSYDEFGISKEDFSAFPFKNGLKAGDLAVILGKDEYSIGDIVVYHANQEAPIIHRIVRINDDGSYTTKGDHNLEPNRYEIYVAKEQVEGKVILVIPKLGLLKMLVTKIIGV